LLGGEIQLRSTPGVAVLLPLPAVTYLGGTSSRAPAVAESASWRRYASPSGRSNRSWMTGTISRRRQRGAHVEDDPHYARVMADLAKDEGFKVLVAHRGADALALARAHHPTAISLDISCRICSAGRCEPAEAGSFDAAHPGAIVTWTKTAITDWARGRSPSSRSRRPRKGLENAFARIKGYAKSRRKRCCWSKMTRRRRNSVTELLGPTTSRSYRLHRRERLLQLRILQSIVWCST